MKKIHSLFALLLTLALAGALWTPALADGEAATPSVEAAAAILLDADYDEVLYEYNADARRYPASITKVMTGLLTVEAIDRGELSMDQVVTLGDTLYMGIGEGGSSQGLKTGEMLTVRDLLCCALIPSANEACNALAVAVAGDIPTFVARMNSRAQELGMTNTHFTNTHGYHDDNHYTTARDISRMCREAMKHPDFRSIVSSKSYVVPETNLHAKRELHDTNAMVSNFRTGSGDGAKLLYRYAVGIKTGFTPEAGYCLASAAEKDGRLMIAVLLGGQYWKVDGQYYENNYFVESRELLEYGFNNFSRKTVLSQIEPVATIPVELCAEQDYVTVQPARALEATLPNDMDPAQFQREVTLAEGLEAPIQKGQVLGRISISQDGREFGTVDLIASTALERSQRLYILRAVKTFFGQLWVKLALLALVVLILIFVVRRMIFGPSRRRRRRGAAMYGGSYSGRRRR